MDKMIKSIKVKSIDEDLFLELFGDNLTIYSSYESYLEDEESRVDFCALELRSDEGDIVVVDDTGAGVDYIIDILEAEGLVVKEKYDVKVFDESDERAMAEFMSQGELVDVKVIRMGEYREYNHAITARVMVIIDKRNK